MPTRSPLLLAALAALAAPAAAQTPTASANPELVQRYQQTITPAELAGYLYVYADDYLAGRETGEPGQRFAARYLAGQYQTMGVMPKGSGSGTSPYNLDGYLQPFNLEQKVLRSLTAVATRDGETILESTIRDGDTAGAVLVPAYGAVDDATPAPVVFVGHADEGDLAPLPLEGAYALMLPGTVENPADRGATIDHVGVLGLRGVRGVLLVSAPTSAALAESAAGAFGGGRLALPAPGGAEPDADDLPPILATSPEVADRLLAGVGRTVESGDDSPAETGVMLSVTADVETRLVDTENVVAVVEGSDPVLKDEYVIISAHLDHVGVADEGEDTIFNGADDDGSGTVTLLEIAEAFEEAKADGHGPRRSVLFLHVTGEEKGLLGSEYFADRDPLVPIENVAANLNIDMIGRHDPERGFDTTDYVYVIGADLISQDIADWNAAVNEATGTGIFLSDKFNSPDDPNQFFRRSDHWNFGKYDVPFIFYFTGTHEDYHGVGDSADKIDYDRMAQIARLVFGTAWEIANADDRPRVSGVGFN
ncbi:M28 family peptidase [Rubrivirga sp. S365]|uniref:M28 family peptidase n=1 Tax=Rubrivirga litoralis TaxID=3075598 RepID=A0ABU3BM87_9BACT|nr:MULTISPECIES: M28 family peptidase [unclassified Rubrivirga]MDT0630385.1 M28 family peptidase [Rubrivirga sp. F394]MDT7855896.1 M28 family peptidase [Rubrivirga sp. S365]